MADRDKAISVLQELIETCHDGHHGYRQAAEHINDPEIRAFFNEQSAERDALANELEDVVERLGGKPKDRGSMVGALHRAWFSAKETITKSDEAVLNSVEAGEDNAKRQYEEALRSDLPADVISVIERQSRSVFAAHDHVRNLRDRYRRAA